MTFSKVVVIGGGVLGAQIALMSAYTGHDTTLWLRSEGSIGRTQPKIARYSSLMIEDLEKAKALLGNPMGAFLYPQDRKSTRRTPVTSVSRMPSSA